MFSILFFFSFLMLLCQCYVLCFAGVTLEVPQLQCIVQLAVPLSDTDACNNKHTKDMLVRKRFIANR